MKITHLLDKKKLSKDTFQDCSFILTNRKGGYIWLNDIPVSRYQGVYFVENSKMYRIIENIGIQGEINEIINKFWCVERIKNNNLERFFMPYGYNSIVYENESKEPCEIILDLKESYINDSQTNYSIDQSENLVILECRTKEEKFYVVIILNGRMKRNDKFIERKYSEDEKRNSKPFSRQVFNLGEIESDRIVISFSSDMAKAVAEAQFISGNIDKLKKKQSEEILDICSDKSKDSEIDMAYNCAKISLYNLAIDEFGIYAGLPWFFQFWARDELMCLKAVKNISQIQQIKERIFDRWLRNCEKTGRVSANITMENKEMGHSLDSFGWLFKRAEEIKMTPERKEEMKKLAAADATILFNKPFETWMDTIPREGARIELQALKINMFHEMHKITGDSVYKKKEEQLRKEVKEKFWIGGILLDSQNDATIRPNIFFAHYVYPLLLEQEEWNSCFDNVLKKLWCEWYCGGGLSSLDKTNEFFVDTYSGENNNSYHKGDSWFWLNNLTAISLNRINKKKFSSFIKKITQASTNEILWMGAIANHSELSSAKQLSSCGCISQAWSAALYIELIDELSKEN
jgi:glycogen debranching enzyme